VQRDGLSTIKWLGYDRVAVITCVGCEGEGNSLPVLAVPVGTLLRYLRVQAIGFLIKVPL
jgi:hypothetical protein